MPLDKTMIINDVFWIIKYVKPNSDMLKRKDDTLTLGVTDLNTRTVYISNVLKGRLLLKVLTHEICHCYIFSYGIYISADDEERLCDFVANYGRKIIKDSDCAYRETKPKNYAKKIQSPLQIKKSQTIGI